MTLWAVGVRYVKEGSWCTRWAGVALIVAALALSLHLSFVSLGGAPEGLRERLSAHLAEGFALQDVRVVGQRPLLSLEVSVRGSRWPPDELAGALARVPAEYLGEPLQLSLQAGWLVEGNSPTGD